MTNDILNTPLTETHIELGAKMAAFAGYNMPISYAGIKEEHQCVRTNVGVFDVSHMGEFIVRGKDALAFVQYVTSNDASKLEIGHAQYSCFPNETGGIVDDLLVYRLPETYCSDGEQAFMLVVNASNIEKDWKHLNDELKTINDELKTANVEQSTINNELKKDSSFIVHRSSFDLKLINISEQTGLLAVQGPNAQKLLQTMTDTDLSVIPYYHFAKGTVAGIDNVLISNTGYTGSGGFELYAAAHSTKKLWDTLFHEGKSVHIQPVGLGARDTLRLEMGYNLYGNDINDTTNPLEAGLGWITKFEKGDFVASKIIQQVKEKGLTRKLVGFKLSDRRVPRHDYEIFDAAGNNIGIVTSGTSSPTLDIPIGMGYVNKPFDVIGTEIFIGFGGGKKLPAVVSKMPFMKN